MKDWEEEDARQQAEFDAMVARDKKARADGQLVGRYLSYQVADGYAWYVVEKVEDGLAHLEHMPLFDAWQERIIEDLGCVVPVKLAELNVKRRDGIERLFAGKRAIKLDDESLKELKEALE